VIGRREMLRGAPFAFAGAMIAGEAQACREMQFDFGSVRHQAGILAKLLDGQTPNYPSGMFSATETPHEDGVDGFIKEFRGSVKCKSVSLASLVRMAKEDSKGIYLANFRRNELEDLIISCGGVLAGENNHFLLKFFQGRLEVIEPAYVFNGFRKLRING
jgi:hypothetical protein